MRLYTRGGGVAKCGGCHRVHSAWQRIPSELGALYVCACGEAAPYPDAEATERVLAGSLVVQHDPDWGGEPLVYGKETP